MTINRKCKLTIAKLKSLRLSCNVVVSLPLESMLNKRSMYEADMPDSILSFISSSLGYMEWNNYENCDCYLIKHHRYNYVYMYKDMHDNLFFIP
jgi:hypothetical protein